jgi:hypothetical protein
MSNYLLLAASAEIAGADTDTDRAMRWMLVTARGKKSKKAGKSRQRLNVFERGGGGISVVLSIVLTYWSRQSGDYQNKS